MTNIKNNNLRRRLSERERCAIQYLRKIHGLSLRKIARIIKCAHTSVGLWKDRDYTHRKPHKKHKPHKPHKPYKRNKPHKPYKKHKPHKPHKTQERIYKNKDLIISLYKTHKSAGKVRLELLKRGIKMGKTSILKRIPQEDRTKNRHHINSGVKFTRASEIDRDLVVKMYKEYGRARAVKDELEKQGIKASLSAIYQVIPKELKNKSKKK